MTTKALIPTDEERALTVEEERRALIAQTRSEDAGAFTLKPPRYRLISMSQSFQNSLTEETVKTLSGAVIASRIMRAYWGESEGNAKSSICASTDGRTGICQDQDRMVEASATIPGEWDRVDLTGPMACLSCPLNQWDSGKGGRGKACKEMRRLLVMPEGASLPAILSIPPSSVGNWDGYASACENQGEAYFSVKTTIAAEKASNPDGISYSKVIFKRADALDSDSLRQVISMRKQYEAHIGAQIEDEEYDAQS